eukprot:GHVT01022535.1.p2 GENE.GHVT01022535.1~~GHVT01022535.1.p2  ORF type:complete len:102 (+),score=3.15 GHVT01022535.1:406-711(+)
MVPAACIRVAESGVFTKEHAVAMRRAGADAVLVGEALVRSANPEEAVKSLTSCPDSWLKICGISDPQTAAQIKNLNLQNVKCIGKFPSRPNITLLAHLILK